MNQLQKVVLSLTVFFVAINVFLVPIIGIKRADISNYSPYIAGYIGLVLIFTFAVFLAYKKNKD